MFCLFIYGVKSNSPKSIFLAGKRNETVWRVDS